MRSVISYWAMDGGSENRLPIRDALAAAKDAGFDGIELAIAESGELSVTSSPSDCFSIREAARRLGLVVETVASGMSWAHCPTHPDALVRQRAITLHHLALQRTAWLGAEAMLYVPGAITIPWDSTFPPVPYGQAVTWARDALQMLAHTAEEVKVDLCVENVWNGLFYSPLEFSQFIDSIASSRVGIYFDVGNVLGYHQHPEHWIIHLGKRIRRVHVKDFRRAVGNLSGFCDLLEGDVSFPRVMQELRRLGYTGTIVAEVGPPRSDLLEKTARSLRQILAMT